MKRQRFNILILIIFNTVFLSCNSHKEAAETTVVTKTPVKIVSCSIEPLTESIQLNATSYFMDKSYVKAPVSGYLKTMEVNAGDIITVGALLFEVQTKESSALNSTKNDSIYSFKGIIKVLAKNNGAVSQADKQAGDYVQEGDDVVEIANKSSLVFLLNVPFEFRNYIKPGSNCDIKLPDNKIIKGSIGETLPGIEPLAQTIKYIIKPLEKADLPENLIANISIIKSVKNNAVTIPKSALLTDESQSEWWVMKLINDSTAIKIPVQKGIETKTKVEITDPVFTVSDRIISEGSYGLSDTAKILITK